ncbi:LacI family DNA-binding transcriptional regulator [Caldimonas brevitalea]|uniref:Transcriptional regulator n=1 Tax=Caldimonas brevitalea TaxID=413882 RepID=A0A0G3BV49_9BURK|nr:substrate-binding domain-containing protein [Caldimonas brevitalea]AKJ30410.1 transcriptional regulator [Caldimonas brevitalea]
MNTTPKRKRSSGATVTTVQVAEAAGVSVATVSRFLTGVTRVSEAKREAIEAAIAQLDFKPNLLAASLKRGRSMTIGVLTQDVNSPFFTETVLGVEAALDGSGYEPLITSVHWNPKEEAERIRRLIARRVDGVIVLSGRLAEPALRRLAQQVPIVATGRQFKTSASPLRGLRLDNEAGGYLATRHLLELGHRQIAHIEGWPGTCDAAERLAGYRRALQEFGVDFDPHLVTSGNFSESGGLLAMNRLLDSGRSFTAVFAANDQTAYGARLALYRRGVRVPEDLALVGFDDLPASLYTTPPLTTVRQPMFEVGKLAAQTLLQLIEGGPAQPQMPTLSLMVRETTSRLR